MPENNQFLALLEQEKPTILSMLPEYVGADRWWSLAYEVSRSKQLQAIAAKNPQSLLAAIKKLADWGLDLDNEEAYIIPYGDSAEAQAGYKGLIRRAIEAGVAVHIYAELVRDGDKVEVVSGSHRELKHYPDPFAKGKPIIGAYAVAVLANGLTDFETFGESDIDAVRKAAERMNKRGNPNAGESPAWRFFTGEMIKKSVIRRLCKRLRGKRDTDAGRRYGQIVATETRFDAETEGAELPPDDLPTPVGGEPLTLEPTPTPGPDRLLNQQEQDDVLAQSKAIGLKLNQLLNLLYEHAGVEDLSQVRLSQLPKLAGAMQQAVGG